MPPPVARIVQMRRRAVGAQLVALAWVVLGRVEVGATSLQQNAGGSAEVLPVACHHYTVSWCDGMPLNADACLYCHLSCPLHSAAWVPDRIDVLCAQVAALLSERQPHFTSPAHLASHTMETLRLSGGVRTFEPPADAGAAVLSAAQQAQLSTMVEEREIIKYLTPHIWASILEPAPGLGDATSGLAPVLVNSEDFTWLGPAYEVVDQRLNLKPDLLLSWRSFVRPVPRKSTQGNPEDDPRYVFGVLADHALQQHGCIGGLLEGKAVPLTQSPFGALCNYHKCVTGICRGMLFNGTEFWLYITNYGQPVSLLKCKWTDAGTAQQLKDFFSMGDPPLLQLLRHLCTSLGVTLTADADGNIFLGAGGSGQVFHVHADGTPAALKVILTASAAKLSTEHSLLVRAHLAGAPVIAPSGKWVLHPSLGGGYLLQKVGKVFAVRTLAMCKQAFESLRQLHLKGFLHGDARLENLLQVDTDLLWVDMATALPVADGTTSADVLAAADALLLARSILGIPPGTDLHSPLVALAKQWTINMTKEQAAAFASAVWQRQGIQ